MQQPFSTSKVTVEYYDPHGIYKLLAPGLVPRLPLRNLHWQSHAGPLRSIDTLHVELLPAGSADPQPVLSPDPFLGPLQQKTESSTVRDTNDGFQIQRIGTSAPTEPVQGTAGHQHATPARRHQIPGLRRTPYLKVLLVRCDDNDSYKSTVRQEIRDWVKANTPPSGSKKTNAENHDAFEWLILHVVIPNTVAATQPRTTGKSESTEKTSAVSARWRTGSSTLLEKLRSDFNSSSKGAVDRIAQIRIGVNDVPYDDLPRVVPAVPSGYKETEEENGNAWADLISKIKSLVLASFDMRVTQYEEDIKEKDGQRSLPGWNFCTFFILKEGLARGFESVGLVEDALVGYDELSFGLDMVIKDQAAVGSTAANVLLGYTAELKELAAKAQAELYWSGEDADEVVDMQATASAGVQSKDTFDEIPISATKRPYRELILENNVSVFDFRCYIFARQIALLLRLGNAWSTREELLAKLKEQQESVMHGVAPRAPPPKQVENEHENLSMLAEICRRTLEFIPSVSQVMRGDVLAALLEQNKKDERDTPSSLNPSLSELLDNLVASFAFSIAQQMLAQTSTKALPIPESTLAPLDGHEPKSAIPEPKTMLHPARNSSLRVSSTAANSDATSRPPSSPNFFPGPGQSRSPKQEGARNNAFLKVGLEELAARRAELYALSRNILEECGKKRGWSDGWAGVPVIGESAMFDMVEVSLEDDNSSKPQEDNAEIKDDTSSFEGIVTIAGIDSRLLRAALDNRDDFYRLYETLTDKALRHYTVANHTHSVQGCMADLAILKYHLSEFSEAASYFYRTTPFFGESGWSLLELSMLVMYSRCLKQLQRKDDYVKVMLKLLSKASSAERDRQQQRTSFQIGKLKDVEYPEHDAIKGNLADLLEESKALPNPVRVPLANFLSKIEIEGPPEYHDSRDSFSVHIKLTSLLVDELTIEKARARLTSQIPGMQREIWLTLSEPVAINPGKNRLKLDSNVVIPGTYEVDRIDFTASNLNLYYEQDSSKSAGILKSTKLSIYHRSETLDVNLIPSKSIQLDRNNTIDIEVDSGWNELRNAEVRVKAATGGLRLLTAEAKCVDSPVEFSKKPEGGLFSFGAIPSQTKAKIRFPYTTEQEVVTVSVRIEVTYTTDGGTFMFSKTPSISITLALGVNVQDVFKHRGLFSRFTVSTATASPLRLFKSELIGSELFDADFGVPFGDPTVVFPRQPATLLYKITRKKGVKITPKSQSTLYLKLEYSLLLDEIAETVRESFLGSLKDSELAMYGRLVAETVLPHVEDGLGEQELERAALLGYVDTRFLTDASVDWPSSFVSLGKGPNGEDAASILAEFIKKWQENNPRLPLTKAVEQDSSRSILIPVDVPSMSIVHTADIKLESPEEPVTTNQLLPATLHLKWTRMWDVATPLNDMTYVEFSYEVMAPGEAWLIGGRRKGHFVIPAPDLKNLEDSIESKAETEADIPLLLIPLREGWLPYPSVDIREVRALSGGSQAVTPVIGGLTIEGSTVGGESVMGGLIFETDFRNQGETVRVVADRERVTLSLDASGAGGGPLILEVSRRCGEDGLAKMGRVVA